LQPTGNTEPGIDGFITKLAAGGNALVYSTYFSGSGLDDISMIAADADGNAYVAGYTSSADLPVRNAYQPFFAGASDLFYAKINPDGSDLVYASYFGGDSIDRDAAMAVGQHGELFIAGNCRSTGLATPGAFQTSFPDTSYWTGTLARFNAADGSLEAATYLDRGVPARIAVDPSGNVVLAGVAFENLALANPLQPNFGGGAGDCFVAKLKGDCSALLFSTYFGGQGQESGGYYSGSLALDSNGDILITGTTSSTNGFPLLNPLQGIVKGSGDAFVAKISLRERLKIVRAGRTVVLSWPVGATNYILEAAASLPAGSWETVTNNPTVTTDEHSVQLSLTDAAKFFRLRKP
jgi:hypothetical protein